MKKIHIDKMNNLEKEVLKITCELYGNLKFSRADLTFIINTFRDFIRNTYNPFLVQLLHDRLVNGVSTEALNAKGTVFDNHKDPFQNYHSEDKRFRLYKQLKLYTDPEICELEEQRKVKFRGTRALVTSNTISMVHLPLPNSLTKMFEMDGLLEAKMSNMSYLQSQKDVYVNFVHGSLWKDQIARFDKTDGIVLPLVVYYDDVETGNALGSHSGENEVGVVNATCPCLPPSFSSKLDRILVTDIFYSHDRKTYGNEKIFAKLISELQYLGETGIKIVVNGKSYKIYFLTSLVLGDNLGANAILGFVTSFSSTHFCRICYGGSAHTRVLTKELLDLLRSKDKYELDAETPKMPETGIKESCIFNRIPGFHVILNVCLDIMHDLFEGVANYVIALILLKLIELNCFSIQELNNILRTMDFDFETSNRPLPISLDYLKKNNWLKMSASEMLFFARYLGLMVGDVVPEDNEYWLLYVKLRQILHILISPILLESHLLELESLIEEHHQLYLDLLGELKAKFHLLTH